MQPVMLGVIALCNVMMYGVLHLVIFRNFAPHSMRPLGL